MQKVTAAFDKTLGVFSLGIVPEVCVHVAPHLTLAVDDPLFDQAQPWAIKSWTNDDGNKIIEFPVILPPKETDVLAFLEKTSTMFEPLILKRKKALGIAAGAIANMGDAMMRAAEKKKTQAIDDDDDDDDNDENDDDDDDVESPKHEAKSENSDDDKLHMGQPPAPADVAVHTLISHTNSDLDLHRHHGSIIQHDTPDPDMVAHPDVSARADDPNDVHDVVVEVINSDADDDDDDDDDGGGDDKGDDEQSNIVVELDYVKNGDDDESVQEQEYMSADSRSASTIPLPPHTQAGDSNPRPTQSEDAKPQPTQSEDSKPPHTHAEDSKPQPTQAEDSKPQLTHAEDTKPQLTHAEDSAPPPTPKQSEPQPETKPPLPELSRKSQLNRKQALEARKEHLKKQRDAARIKQISERKRALQEARIEKAAGATFIRFFPYEDPLIFPMSKDNELGVIHLRKRPVYGWNDRVKPVGFIEKEGPSEINCRAVDTSKC